MARRRLAAAGAPAQRHLRVRFDFASESDRIAYPLGSDTRLEGGSDRHAVIVDRSTCRLYEAWATRRTATGWRAGSGATWSLASNRLRPDGWTSADAAGLPILPGLLRWNEVKAGYVDHARSGSPPTSPLAPACGRLATTRGAARSRRTRRWVHGSGSRRRTNPVGLGACARVVVRAMKTYGLVLADNGSPWFFQGERNAQWPPSLIEDLERIPASAFVAVDTSSLRVSRDSAAVAQ